VELRAVTRAEARVFKLPGRDWLHYIGPEINGSKNLTVGFSVFPPDSAPKGHIHPTQEEVIYIISGHGELVPPQGTAVLEPGTCVYIPVGLHHQTVSHGPDPLEMVTSFSPRLFQASARKMTSEDD